MTAIPTAPLAPVAEFAEPTDASAVDCSTMRNATVDRSVAESATASNSGFVAAVRDFFHGTETPYRLALVRICLAFAILFPTAYRWYYSREIFSTDGSGISLWSIYGYPCPWLEPNGTAAVAIHSVVILALVTTCLGWCTRLSLVLAATGYTYLNMLDILSTLNKSSAIASHFLILLCFTQCGSVWSIDSWLARRRLLRQGVSPDQLPAPPLGARWPRRLIQLVLATVYFSAAVTKLQVRGYFTGEHLQTWMLSTIHTPNFLGGSLALHPAILVVGAYFTAIWELLFQFIVWNPMLRTFVLALGAFFHLMTCLTLGGESTRPGATPVSADEEIRRVVPVIAEVARRTPVPISIDTTKADVARRALDAGAAIVNDISGQRFDPEMAPVCAAAQAGVVCMHMQGTPQTMQYDPRYADVVGEISAYLAERLAALSERGIERERVVLDPGIGFG